jgi:hypothetical protein
LAHYDEFRDKPITLPKTALELQLQQIVYERNQLLKLLLNYMSMDDIMKCITSQR